MIREQVVEVWRTLTSHSVWPRAYAFPAVSVAREGPGRVFPLVSCPVKHGMTRFEGPGNQVLITDCLPGQSASPEKQTRSDQGSTPHERTHSRRTHHSDQRKYTMTFQSRNVTGHDLSDDPLTRDNRSMERAS